MKRWIFIVLMFLTQATQADYWYVTSYEDASATPVGACQKYVANYTLEEATFSDYSHISRTCWYLVPSGFGYASSIKVKFATSDLQPPDGSLCTDLDNYTGSCNQQDCSQVKPVSSPMNLSQGCYNNCQYENIGAIRDYDNLLAPVQYEYLNTGLSCTSLDQPISGTTEYSETNDDGFDCRTTDQYQVCIDAETSCKIIDGIQSCIDNETREQDYNCGTFNGEVVCIQKSEQTRCSLVNGERLCVYPEGEAIDIGSVDHPDNGGNGDGDSSNDILDEQDLTDNSLTAQQVKDIVQQAIAKQQAEKQAEQDNPKSAVSGIECDRTMNCTGDPVQCAIAQYEKRQACLHEYKASSIQQMIDGNPNSKPLGAYESDTTVIDVENLITDDGRFTETASCPEPLSFSVKNSDFTISLDPMCDLAGYIRYFILFATWFSIAVVIAKSF